MTPRQRDMLTLGCLIAGSVVVCGLALWGLLALIVVVLL